VEEFFWGEFCDWYLETVKPRVLTPEHERAAAAQEILHEVLAVSLRLLHPFMPYVTEEIWQHLRNVQPHLTESVAMAQWPGTAEGQPVGSESALEAWDDPEAEADMALVIEVITAIRNLRSERQVEPSRALQAYVPGSERLRREGYLINGLANVVLQPPDAQAPSDAVRLLLGNSTELLIAGLFDLTAERARLREKLSSATTELERAEGQLQQPGFRERAPAHVVQKAEERLAAARQRAANLEQQLQAINP